MADGDETRPGKAAKEKFWDRAGRQGARAGAVKYSAPTVGWRMHVHTRVLVRAEPALRRLSSVLPAIERAPAWARQLYPHLLRRAETLWLMTHGHVEPSRGTCVRR